MAKTFYTDKDIEEMHRNGIKSLRMTDDAALTDLAYEKARRLDFQIISDHADAPPAAPVRPYLSDMKPRPTQGKPASVSRSSASASTQGDVAQRIRSTVLARLGNQVDAKLLDNIIHRVVKSVGLK